MKLATSKITAQGQISVPLEVRRRLGLTPGAVLQWETQGAAVVVRRRGTHTLAEVRQALFPAGPPAAHDLDELKAGIESYIRAKHARR
jgi:AbrB family looped-hinge helix DNA binding protein